jgi:hypothetical protein
VADGNGQKWTFMLDIFADGVILWKCFHSIDMVFD